MADYQQNFLGALQGGLDFGQQVKRQRDQSALGQLASQAYGAAPEQRTSLLGQMATISPQAAQAQQNAWDGDEDRRNKSMVNMARLLTSAPEEARPGLWRSFVPTLSQYGLSELPPEYNEQTAPIITKAAEALARSYGGGMRGLNNPYDGLPSDIQSLRLLQDYPELAALDRERRQAAGMVPKMVETAQGIGWGTPGGGIRLAPLEGVAGQPERQLAPAPQLFSALSQKYGIRPTSVQRTPDRNRDVGGVEDSYHLSGQAADWVVPQQYKAQFVADARANGYEAIDEGDHIHIEPAPSGGVTPNVAQPYVTPKEESELDRRIRAAREMGASEDDIRRMVLGRDGAAAGAKPLPPSVLKLREEAIAEAETARAINDSLDRHIGRIKNGQLNFGPLQNLIARGRNEFGASDQGSRNFAEFTNDLEKLRNDSLRLNSGVQTDGDAQRAWNELFSNLNDTQYVAQRLETIRRLNERAETLKRASVERIDAEYGRDSSQPPATPTDSTAPRVRRYNPASGRLE